MEGLYDFAERVAERAEELAGEDQPAYSGPLRRGRPAKRKAKETGRSSGTEKRSQFEREVDQIKKRTAALQAEAETIGATTYMQEKAKAAAELRYAVMATAAKEGRKVTEAELASIEKLADAYAAATAQAEFLGSAPAAGGRRGSAG